MFCQHCGGKHEQEAKFCPECGKPVSSGGSNANEVLVEAMPLEERVFLDQGGILVSDAVFKTSLGASYPIRNISSVSVAPKPTNSFVLILAILVTLFGLFLMIGSVVVGMIVMAFSAPFWFMLGNTAHQLKIGAGGVLQTAIESSNQNQLDLIAKAINESILYIQRSK